MRMPVAAQRASIPVALSAGVDFSSVMIPAFGKRMIRLGIPSGLARKRFNREIMRHFIVRSF